jgi:hypothetical protein
MCVSTAQKKTIADCFKYRNRIGMDTVLEALSLYRERRKQKLKTLMQYARICRVEKIMRSYLTLRLVCEETSAKESQCIGPPTPTEQRS